MGANHIDALLMMEGTSLDYFTGIRWWGGERLFAMVLPAKGAAFYVCPAFEEERAREQIAVAPGSKQADIRTWQEDDNPYQRLAQGLRDRRISTGKLGMEETVRFLFTNGIANAAPQVSIVSGTPITAGCRMVKSDHEIALMQLANKATLAAYEATYLALREGMTQSDVSELIAQAYTQLGFPGEASVQVGEYSANPHGSATPQVIREGSIVMVDDGCTVEGYQSDITRTFVLGKASDKMKKVFDDRASSANRRVEDRATGFGVPGRGCGRAKSDYRRRLWTGLQILHSSPGTRHWHGRPRMALSGARKHHSHGREHDVQ